MESTVEAFAAAADKKGALAHGDLVSWAGFAQNMVPVTLGNIVGGALFVGGLYWLAAPVKTWHQPHLTSARTIARPDHWPLATETM